MNKEMNTVVRGLLENGSPKITTLSEVEKNHYRFGLKLLGYLVAENFFDLPKLPDHKYDHSGLFYSIPYFDDVTLWSMDNKRMLLVVYKIENRSSFCPMSMEIQTVDADTFKIIVNDQSGQRTIKRDMISREDGRYFTEIEGYDNMTLSELLNLGAGVS